MTKIVAAKGWVCEYCELFLYDRKDMEGHLREKHGINDRKFEYNANNIELASHMVVAEFGLPPIPETLVERMVKP